MEHFCEISLIGNSGLWHWWLLAVQWLQGRRYTKLFKRVFVLSDGTLFSLQERQGSSLHCTSD
jgi:hypothetical protein